MSRSMNSDRLRIEVCKLYLCGTEAIAVSTSAKGRMRLTSMFGRNELERKLGDDTERALQADHQVQQAVARACLANGLAKLHNSAVWQNSVVQERSRA